jgi:hypothetical protein
VEKAFKGIKPQTNPENSTGSQPTSSGDLNTVSAVFSSPANYYKAMRNSTNNTIEIWGYVTNPSCDSSAKYPTVTDPAVNMYKLKLNQYNNRYGSYYPDTNVFQPYDSQTSGPAFTKANRWERVNNVFPVSTTGLPEIRNPSNAEDCKKKAGAKGATEVYYNEDSRRRNKKCYYTTEIPEYGKVSLDTQMRKPDLNNKPSVYIRTQADTKGTMPKLNAGEYSFGDALEPTILGTRSWWNQALTPYVASGSGIGSGSGVTQGFTGARESFVEGYTTNELDAGIQSANNISTWGSNSNISVAQAKLAALDTSMDNLNTASNQRTAIPPYSKTDGVSYEEAKVLYNLVHPNTQKTAKDGLEVDSNELRMQYNNMFMVGSIAATTFAIAAIVTLSLR